MEQLRRYAGLKAKLLVAAIAFWPAAAVAQKPRLYIPTGHTGRATCARFSDDGTLAVTSSTDGTVRLWDAATGQELETFREPRPAVKADLIGTVSYSMLACAISHDNKRLLTLCDDGIVRVREIPGGKELSTVILHPAIGNAMPGYGDEVVDFGDDGETIVTSCFETGVQLWDAHTGKSVSARIGQSYAGEIHGPKPIDVAVTQEELELWSRGEGKLLATISAEVSKVASDPKQFWAAAVSPDGKKLVTVRGGGKCEVYELPSRRLLSSWQGPADGIWAALRFSPDGARVVIRAYGELTGAKVYDVATGALSLDLNSTVYPVNGAASFSQDGSRIIAPCGDGSSVIWDAHSGRLVSMLTSHGAPMNVAWFWPPSDRPVQQSALQVWVWSELTGRPETGTLKSSYPADAIPRVNRDLFNSAAVRSIYTSGAISDDGARVLTPLKSEVRIVDIATGKALQHFLLKPQLPDGSPSDVRPSASMGNSVFSVDSRRVFTIGPLTGWIWDAGSGKLVKTLDAGGHAVPITQGAFSRDGSRLVTTQYGMFGGPWDAATNQGGVRIWDVATGRLLSTHVAEVKIYWAEFSPDGKSIVMATDNSEVLVWDPVRNTVNGLAGHSGAVRSVSFSPDGKFMMTASVDGSARIWDAKTYKELCALVPVDDHWVVATSEGRFDTDNLDGAGNPYWIMGDDVFHPLALEAFMRQFYTPNLLTRIIHGPPLTPLAAIENLNIGAPLLGKPVVTPSSLERSDTVDVTVEVSATPGRRGDGKSTASGGAYDVHLYRNGRLVGYTPDGVNQTSGLVQFKKIPLAPGDGPNVEFSAYAFNRDRVKSATVRTTYSLPKLIPPRKGRLYVVCIGVNQCDVDSMKLSFAAHDADAMAKSVTSIARTGDLYESVVAAELLADNSIRLATKARIKAVFDILSGRAPVPDVLKGIAGVELLRKVRPEDTLLVSWSGHGITINDEFYLVPTDSGAMNARGEMEDANKLVSSDELAVWMRDIDSTQMALMIDACESSLADDPAFQPGPMGDRGIGQLAYDKKMLILTASQDAAEEDPALGMGRLSYALVKEGLLEKKAGAGNLNLRAWLKYAEGRVPQLSKPRTKAGYVQQPELFDFEQKPKERPFLTLK